VPEAGSCHTKNTLCGNVTSVTCLWCSPLTQGTETVLFYVLLTMHLSIILVINQRNAQNL